MTFTRQFETIFLCVLCLWGYITLPKAQLENGNWPQLKCDCPVCLCSSVVYVSRRLGSDIPSPLVKMWTCHCFSASSHGVGADTYTAYRHVCTPACLRAPDCVGLVAPGPMLASCTSLPRDAWQNGPTVVCRSLTCSWWGRVLWRTLQIWGPKLDTIICICVELWESTVDTIISQEPHRHVCSILCTCMASCVTEHVSVHVRVGLLSICNIMHLRRGQVACDHW